MATDSVENAQNRGARVRVRVHGKASATRSMHSTIADGRPGRNKPRRKPIAISTPLAKVLKEEQKRTGINLLWGHRQPLQQTARYMHGRRHEPELRSLLRSPPPQVKKALEVTKELGGGGYTFLGAVREGYHNLWNTNMKREAGASRPSSSTWPSITPKRSASPASSTSSPSQRKPDQAPVRCRRRGLRQFPPRVRSHRSPETKPRDETTPRLAGHSMQHENGSRRHFSGILGSIDANTGGHAPRLGYRSSSRPTSISPRSACTRCSSTVASPRGGVNFDAKVRRESFRAGGSVPRPPSAGMDAFGPRPQDRPTR